MTSYHAECTDLSAILEQWRRNINLRNNSSTVEKNFIRISSKNDLDLVNIEETRYKSKSVPMKDHEVSYPYPFTDYIHPRFCADFSPISTYRKPHHRLVRNLKSIPVNHESNLRDDRERTKRARRWLNSFFRGKRKKLNQSSSIDEYFKLEDQWNKTHLLPRLVEASQAQRIINETTSGSPSTSQNLNLYQILRLHSIPKKTTAFVKKRRKRNVRNRKDIGEKTTDIYEKEIHAYSDIMQLLHTTKSDIESQLTYNTEHQSEIDRLQTTLSWLDQIGTTTVSIIDTHSAYEKESTKGTSTWHGYDDYIGTMAITPKETISLSESQITTRTTTYTIGNIPITNMTTMPSPVFETTPTKSIITPTTMPPSATVETTMHEITDITIPLPTTTTTFQPTIAKKATEETIIAMTSTLETTTITHVTVKMSLPTSVETTTKEQIVTTTLLRDITTTIPLYTTAITLPTTTTKTTAEETTITTTVSTSIFPIITKFTMSDYTTVEATVKDTSISTKPVPETTSSFPVTTMSTMLPLTSVETIVEESADTTTATRPEITTMIDTITTTQSLPTSVETTESETTATASQAPKATIISSITAITTMAPSPTVETTIEVTAVITKPRIETTTPTLSPSTTAETTETEITMVIQPEPETTDRKSVV